MLVVAHQYQVENSPCPFVNSGLWKSAWFGYVRLMKLEGDKTCSGCGKYPENIIWDGVSISFACKHVMDTLEPPTVIEKDAPIQDICRCTGQEWFVDLKMQKKLHGWLGKGGLSVPKTEGGDVAKQVKSLEDMMECVEAFKDIQGWLEAQNKHLGVLFEKHLGFGALVQETQWSPDKCYVTLFKLVSVFQVTIYSKTH